MGIWIDKTSTLPVNPADGTPLSTLQRRWSITYTLTQQVAGPWPYTVADARLCAATHAIYGDAGFLDNAWTGACSPIVPATDVGWGVPGQLNAGVSSQFTEQIVTIPATYGVTVTKDSYQMTVDTQNSTAFQNLILADTGATRLNQIDYEVFSITLTASVTSTGAAGSTDWTGILRCPTTTDGSFSHFITPDDLAAYPQVGTVAPTGSASFTEPLIQSTASPTSFYQALYVGPDLAETGAIDLGASSNRAASWQLAATSLLVHYRYRFKIAPPLHQRQRAAGGTDGHVSFTLARSTRQSSLLARGML